MGENDKKIQVDDINYAIYKVGSWKNNYDINQIGLSNEVPATENTKKHVIFTMDEIRKAEFEINKKPVNGFVAIAYQTNPKINSMDIEDIIDLEIKEYENIKEELENIDLLNNEDTIDLNTDKYLIYKLEKECHLVKSTPANEYTMNHHLNEIKKIEESLSN